MSFIQIIMGVLSELRDEGEAARHVSKASSRELLLDVKEQPDPTAEFLGRCWH